MGMDNNVRLEEFLFKGLGSQRNDDFDFNMVGVDAALANASRRILIAHREGERRPNYGRNSRLKTYYGRNSRIDCCLYFSWYCSHGSSRNSGFWNSGFCQSHK